MPLTDIDDNTDDSLAAGIPMPLTEEQKAYLRGKPLDVWVRTILIASFPFLAPDHALFNQDDNRLKPMSVLYTLAVNIVGIEAGVVADVDIDTSLDYAESDYALVRVHRVMYEIVHLTDFADLPGVEHLGVTQEAMREAWEAYGACTDLAQLEADAANVYDYVRNVLPGELLTGQVIVTPEILGVVTTALRMAGLSVRLEPVSYDVPAAMAAMGRVGVQGLLEARGGQTSWLAA